jgi:transketolase
MDIRMLEEKVKAIRALTIQMLVEAGSGHTAGPLGLADIFAAFYFHILRHDPRRPDWPDRDRLVLSNGHCVPVQYACLALAGYFPIEECMTLRQFGSRLQGHPERSRLPGLETTSGPLGEGLSQAAGMAYALRMPSTKLGPGDQKQWVYCVMSDGEQEEGNTWEAVMFAAKYKLANLIAVIDRNHIQIDGVTEDVMPLKSLRAKYEAFNWNVIGVDGNDGGAFIQAIEKAQSEKERPTLIIAHTIAGKGVKEIEGDYRWHGRVPTKEEGERFIEEIRHD